MQESSPKKLYVWKKSLRTILYRRLKAYFNRHQGRRVLFPGFLRFLSKLCEALQPKGPILVHLENMDLCINGMDQVITPEILMRNVYEPPSTALLKRELKPGMTFLDLGANFGYFTILAGKLTGGNGNVYAFEPEPVNLSYLKKNILLNRLQNVTVVQKIVSNRSGVSILYLDERNLGGHTCAKGNIPIHYSRSLEVSATTLDDFVDAENLRVDFIKMDVQGAEGLVLEKSTKTFARFPVKILMELWPAGLRRMRTDPRELLDSLSHFFSFQIVGDPLEPADPSEILRKAGHHYLNLFLEKK